MKLQAFCVLGVVVSLYGALLVGKTRRYDGNLSALTGFGCLSDTVCYARDNRQVLPQNSVVFRTGGYDGQFYYYIAASIYSGSRAVVDSIPFRYSRIGYPLLTGWAYLISPDALLPAMIILPVIAHLAVSLMLLLYGYGSRPGDTANFFAAFVFAVNPFSLLCFALNLADGLALSLMTAALLLYRIGPRSFLPIFFLSSASLLTKETFSIIPVSFAAAHFFFILRRREDRKEHLQSTVLWMSSLIPAAVWWAVCGLTPALIAEHGSGLFSGLTDYLKNPDALFSGRGFLLLMIVAYIAVLPVLVRALASKGETGMTVFSLAMAIGLILNLGLVFKASHEYWDNFANIARLFMPGLIPIVFIPITVPLRFGRLAGRMAAIAICILCILFTSIIFRNETMHRPAPWEVLTRE